jgi:hypothetical protein
MAEPTVIDECLRELASRLDGSRRTRRRVLTEIRDHLEDAVDAHLDAGMPSAEAEQLALERLGPPASLAAAWEARCSRQRTRRRGRVGMLVAAAAVASLLGVAQHAEGRRAPASPPRGCAAGALPGHCLPIAPPEGSR